MNYLLTWQDASLENHVDLLTGFPFKSQQFTEEPSDIPLVKGANVHQAYIDWKEAKRWSASEFSQYKKFQLQSGDVVVAMDRPWIEAGLKYAWIRPNDPKSLLVQRVARLRGTNGLLTVYLRYLIGSPAFTDYIKPIVTGVTVPHISADQIKGFKFLLPPLPIQRKIAGILSAYDDLIENNTRRIEILEEMARSIYREWFVKFRFPGHEQVQMVDSELGLIPEGWEAISLGQLLDIKHGYAFKGEYFSKEPTSDILLTPGNFKFGGGFKDDKFKYYDGSIPNEFVLNPGDLLVTMTDLSKEGDTLGYPAFVPPSKELRFLHNQRLGKISLHNPQLGLNHLYHIFCSDSYRHHVLASATGSTVKHTAPDRIKSFSIALPSPEICNRFEMITSSLSRKIILLNQKNTNLRQTRDLLLPRLISGKIDVENLDINIDQIAA